VLFLNEQVTGHPGVVSRISIGNTYSGSEIYGLRIGSTSNPVFYIHCTIHAREWITTTTCLWIIDSLLNTDPDGPELIQAYQWIIVPVFNIDGYQYAHNSDRLWRKNRSPVPSSSCLGTDLNRNYGYGFGGGGSSNNPCAETYRGTSAYSTPEVSSERDFLDSYNVAVYVDIHAYGAMFMSPYGNTYNLPPDYPAMEALMASAVDEIYLENSRTYAYGSSANVIYIAAGGSDDWAYGINGVVPSFTIECAGSSFTPPVSWIRPMGREIYAGMKQLAKDVANGLKK